MLTKIKIALSAFLIAGFASAALASGSAVSDNWVGTADQPSTGASGFASAYASAANGHPVKTYTAQDKALFDRLSASGLN